MRKGLLGSLAALAASAGLAQAQAPANPVPIAPGSPGRSAVGIADAVPIGPAMIDQPPAQPMPPMGGFSAAIQPQFGMDSPSLMGGGYPGVGEPDLSAERAFVELDYLLYFIRSQKSNYPLVTASTTAQLGAVGVGTTVLFGMENLNFNPFNGGRFTIAEWAPWNSRVGAEFTGTVLATRSDTFVAGYGQQTIARPVIDANTGATESLLVAAPGYATGGVGVTATSQFWGFEANAKWKLYTDTNRELTFIAGFRYSDLYETLSISQRSMFIPGNIAVFYGLTVAPQEIDVADSFQTRNQYYLPQVGLQGQWRSSRWTVQVTGKIGIGDVHETSVINGSSTLIPFPTPPATSSPPNTVPGGLLALSSNIGRYHKDQFVVNPEGTIQLGYRLFRNTDVLVGYQFNWMSKAIRPGSQIDAVVNPLFIPTSGFYGFGAGGVGRPAPLMNQVDVWVQGVSVALHMHF